MRTISPADIATALAHCEPARLAAALATVPNDAFTGLAHAVRQAAELKAAYPPDDVIAEADALLYEVLRWPIADTHDTGLAMDPHDLATQRDIPLPEAQRILQHLTATDGTACDQLIASGIEPNFTLAQAQVYDCITTLRDQGRIPTRALVREHALALADAAMRPDASSPPIVYSPDPALGPRINSPSPKVHALLWLDRLEANPPATGFLEQRIAYLDHAKAEMAQASSLAAAAAYTAEVPAPPTSRGIDRPVRAELRLAV